MSPRSFSGDFPVKPSTYQSNSQLTSQRVNLPVNQSTYQSTSQPVNVPVNQSTYQSNSQIHYFNTISYVACTQSRQSTSQLTSQPVNLPVNQSSSQSNSQLTSQPVEFLVKQVDREHLFQDFSTRQKKDRMRQDTCRPACSTLERCSSSAGELHV